MPLNNKWQFILWRKPVDSLLGDCWCGSFHIVLQKRLVTHCRRRGDRSGGWNLASHTEKHLPRREEWSLKWAFLAGVPVAFVLMDFHCASVSLQQSGGAADGPAASFNKPSFSSLQLMCSGSSYLLSLSLLPFSLPRLQEDPPTGVSGAPSENNIMLWNAVIFGWVRL